MSGEKSVDVSVVIAARNEASNIEACMASVRWAREILVVENDSIDDTLGIATRAGASVFSNPFSTIGAQRNAAIDRATSDWILVLDADERATDALGKAVRSTIASPAHEAYRIPRRNFFLGREIRHGGWERDRPVRLFRRSLRYDASRVHERVETLGAPGVLSEPLLHYTYTSLDQYFEKFDRYSKWWAADRFARGRRAGPVDVFFRPRLRFFSMYVLRGGWMDGAAGAVLASLASASVLAKYARLWALSRKDE
ncbi:MAG: glycosyltransferase family 2 protein [Gemmatimonadaceae bacterium]|nr:glycosyltransferase family 2 protein [Gemmatimonadaceae bacterium]